MVEWSSHDSMLLSAFLPATLVCFRQVVSLLLCMNMFMRVSSCLVFKAVPSLRVRYGDVAQNGPADDVVAVATGPIFLKGTELTTESIQTVTSLKKWRLLRWNILALPTAVSV